MDDNFNRYFKDATLADVDRVLALKGLKRGDYPQLQRSFQGRWKNLNLNYIYLYT